MNLSEGIVPPVTFPWQRKRLHCGRDTGTLAASLWRVMAHEESQTIGVTLFPGEEKSPDELDRLSRNLLREAGESGMPSQLASAAPATGAKSGVTVEIGKVLLSVLPAAIPKLIELLNTWLGRADGRVMELTLPNGTTVKIKGKVTKEQIEAIGAVTAPRA